MEIMNSCLEGTNPRENQALTKFMIRERQSESEAVTDGSLCKISWLLYPFEGSTELFEGICETLDVASAVI